MVVAVAELSGESAVELNDPGHGLGTAVVRTAGGEVRQERIPSSAQGPAHASDFGDRTGVE